MWIKKLTVHGLGPFQDERSLSFTQGVNVVFGGNESGKTTLVEALYGAFYGLPVNSPILTSDNPARVKVEFESEAGHFVLERDFVSRDVSLMEKKGRTLSAVFQGTLEDTERGEEWARALEHCALTHEADVWLNSGLVRDGDLNADLEGPVRALMNSKRVGEHDDVLGRMEARLDALVAPEGRSPGQLDEVRRELEFKREELSQWEENAVGVENARAEFEASRQEETEAKREVGEQETALANLSRFEQLSRDRIRLEETLVDLRDERDRIRSHVEAVEKGEKRLEEEFSVFLDAPTDIEDIIQLWTDASNRVQSVDRDLNRARTALAEVPATNTARNGGIAAVVLVALGALACWGAGALALAFFLSPLLGTAGFGGVWYLDRNAGKLRAARETELTRLMTERENVLEIQKEARRDLGSLLTTEDPAELRRQFRAYLQARNGVEQARSVCASHPPLSEVVNNYEKVFGELQLLDTQIRDLVAQAHYLSGIDSNDETLTKRVEAVRAAREAARDRRENLAKRGEELAAEISRREAALVTPGHLGEDVAALERREAELAGEAGALQVAVTVLREAVESYQGDHLGRIARLAGNHLGRFTEDRYRELRFTGDVSSLQVKNGDRWSGMSRVSRIVRDQLSLALRFSVAEALDGKAAFPLVLDEAFPGWDDRRLSQAQAAVAEMATSGRQSIVLSTDARLSSWVKKPVELPAADLRPPRAA